MKKIITTAALTLASSMSSNAAITFVSVKADLSNVSPSAAVTTTDSRTDNLWRSRTGFGEGDIAVLEGWENSAATNREDLPVLAMTLTTSDGIVANTEYSLYVNYIRFGASAGDTDGNRGGIAASLTSTGLFTTYNAVGGAAELSGHAEADRVGMSALVGTAFSDATGNIQIFVDGSSIVEERVWFDGASFEAVAVPEPSSAALLGLGGLALVLRRRK